MPKIKKMVSGENDHWCGLLKPANAERFGAMLTGTPEEQLDDQYPSILLGEVADQALIELAQRILTGTQESHDKTSFFVTDNILPKEASVLGSGAMVIWVKVGNLPFAYIVSPQIVENYLKSCDQPPQETRRKLVPVLSALDRQKVRANVSLGSAELSLGDLGTIQVGDVVTLNRRINEPSVMRFGANGIACKGFIGAKGKSLAFRISQIENKEYA
ncbi:MAG: FliM/FliN family flagellar motor C-terminal domain-containing protein [Candidatus Thiodiazotropha sp.]